MEASYGGGQGPEGAVASCMEFNNVAGTAHCMKKKTAGVS